MTECFAICATFLVNRKLLQARSGKEYCRYLTESVRAVSILSMVRIVGKITPNTNILTNLSNHFYKWFHNHIAVVLDVPKSLTDLLPWYTFRAGKAACFAYMEVSWQGTGFMEGI